MKLCGICGESVGGKGPDHYRRKHDQVIKAGSNWELKPTYPYPIEPKENWLENLQNECNENMKYNKSLANKENVDDKFS